MGKQKKSSNPIAKQVLELTKLILEIIYLVYQLIKGFGD